MKIIRLLLRIIAIAAILMSILFIMVGISFFKDAEIGTGIFSIVVAILFAGAGFGLEKLRSRFIPNSTEAKTINSYTPNYNIPENTAVSTMSTNSADNSSDSYSEKGETIKIVCFDTETTGLSPSNDELLQFSAIDENYNVLLNTYIKPKSHLSWDEAMKVNGITPDMVKDAPYIDEVLPQINDILNRAQHIIGYNINFDLSFLASIGCRVPQHRCIDVMNEASVFMANTYGIYKTPKLTKLATCYGYDFNAHDSLADSKATLFCYYKLINNEPFTVNPEEVPDEKKRYRKNPSNQTKALIELKALIKDVISDNKLTDEEVFQLRDWLEENNHLRGNYPYDRIANAVEKALDDGILEDFEREEMLSLFNDYLKPKGDNIVDVSTIEFTGKNFVLSGEFEMASKEDIANLIIERGGLVKSAVSGKTNYLIVGGMGSDAWSFGNYGTKVKKAKEFQEKGVNIIILSENDFKNLIN